MPRFWRTKRAGLVRAATRLRREGLRNPNRIGFPSVHGWNTELIEMRRLHLLIRFQACEWQAPTRWVLQFGSAAEVLGPLEFRTHVVDRVSETLARYERRHA